ncbi:hypothetical protein, partial [Tessaracoccus sp.]
MTTNRSGSHGCSNFRVWHFMQPTTKPRQDVATATVRLHSSVAWLRTLERLKATMTIQNLADVGVIGMAVMGSNL